MLRKGFTLIELLIVITIIAILAGAALPYVQDYVEDARLSKAKSDMAEIKNALMRWEVDNGRFWDGGNNINNLVGVYLEKPLLDPWGNAYVVDGGASLVLCVGPNGLNEIGKNDDFTIDFRPPLAVSKAFWVDVDKDSFVSSGDTISVRFSRPCRDTTFAAAGVITVASPAPTSIISSSVNADKKSGTITLGFTGTGTSYTTLFNLKVSSAVTDTASNYPGSPFKMRDNTYSIKPL